MLYKQALQSFTKCLGILSKLTVCWNLGLWFTLIYVCSKIFTKGVFG